MGVVQGQKLANRLYANGARIINPKYDFYNLKRTDIISGLAKRKSDPWRINQAYTSLCGMAIVAYFYAKERYEEYKQFVLDLHEFGEATSKAGYTLTTDSDKHLQDYKSGDKKYPDPMEAVDFVILASLRDYENGVFDYDPDWVHGGSGMEGTTGMTFPKDVYKLMKELIGFTDVQDHTNLVFSKTSDSSIEEYIQGLKDQLANGYSIAMFINSSMFDNNKPGFTTPNHWIGLEGIKYNVSTKEVTMKYFSWASMNETKKAISRDVFIDTFFGHIEGK